MKLSFSLALLLASFSQLAFSSDVYATYTDTATGLTTSILLDGYSGAPTAYTGNTTIAPTTFGKALKSGNVCKTLLGCAGGAASSSALYSEVAANATVQLCKRTALGFEAALHQGKFAAPRQAIKGQVEKFALQITKKPASYINVAFKVVSGVKGNNADKCNNDVPRNVANFVATSYYNFCLGLHKGKESSTKTRYDKADVGTISGNAKGKVLVTKFYVSNQPFTYKSGCSDEGVNFKRAARLFR